MAEQTALQSDKSYACIDLHAWLGRSGRSLIQNLAQGSVVYRRLASLTISSQVTNSQESNPAPPNNPITSKIIFGSKKNATPRPTNTAKLNNRAKASHP